MATVYNFKHTDGSIFLPIADGTHDLEGIYLEHPSGQVHLIFYQSDKTTVATPTGGTVAFRASIMDGQFIDASSNGTVNAADVQSGNASYTPPVFNGPVKMVRATFAGITGGSAAFVAIKYWGAS